MDLSTVPVKGLVGRPPLFRCWPACWTAVLYYVAAEAAHLLASATVPLPYLRPGGPLLLALLLTQPARLWWTILLAAVPAHLLAQVQHAAPLLASLPWLVSDCTQALLGAAGALWFLRAPLRFDVLRDVTVFACWCAFIAPAFALLPEVVLQQGGRVRAELAGRILGNAALLLVLVPAWISMCSAAARGWRRALREGPLAGHAVVLLFALAVLYTTARGTSPFATAVRAGESLLLPVFLAALAVPALMVSAALAERRGTLAALQREQERLGQALEAERKRAERLASERRARSEVERQVAARTAELHEADQRLQAEAAALQRQRDQLAHLTRVLALGELSGALAHELNQPLAAILANAQAARRCLTRPGADPAGLRAILDDIVADDQRAVAVIRRLRALFRNEAPALRPVPVAALVRGTLDLARAALAGQQVQVLLELDDALVVAGDRVQLRQVLLNLMANASQAMQAVAPARRRLRVSSMALPHGTVQLTVADNGPGIAADVLDKVFEPRFTTKDSGLGVGLSIARAIICQHGGQIDAFNNPAGGCTFRVRLPAYVEVPDVT